MRLFGLSVGVKLRLNDIKNADSFINRFWKKVIKTKSDDCWEWTAYKNKKGYGQLGLGSRGEGTILAHRASYLIHNKSLCTNLMVLHKCDNPSCVNPEHLYQGTASDNTKDMIKRNRSVFGGYNPASGEKNSNSKLTGNQIKNIRKEIRHMSCRQLGKKYGVAHSTIARIIRGETWNNFR